jgi:hypothetical protein
MGQILGLAAGWWLITQGLCHYYSMLMDFATEKFTLHESTCHHHPVALRPFQFGLGFPMKVHVCRFLLDVTCRYSIFIDGFSIFISLSFQMISSMLYSCCQLPFSFCTDFQSLFEVLKACVVNTKAWPSCMFLWSCYRFVRMSHPVSHAHTHTI